MMPRLSPPNHRHDGTSPLPLGMDWSPPPRKWNGQDTVWPHDPRTGWSYCVTIPSWVVLPKSRDSDPVVFYRVQVGVQSPGEISITRGVLRRFNDFLKLFSDLKKAFPKKSLPPAPPKGLLRMKSRELLEERRCSLEEWMTKLLSDIDISRTVAVASFLELEAAARSSFQDVDQQASEANNTSNSTTSSPHVPPLSSLSLVGASSSITSDYGSDTAYDTSDLGTPRLGKDENFETGVGDITLGEDLTNPIEKLVNYGISNIDEGLFMGQTILEQLEGFPRHKPHANLVNNVVNMDNYNGNGSKASFLSTNGLELFSEPERGKTIGHARKLSTESAGSDISSLRNSDFSLSGIPNVSADGSLDLSGGAEVSISTEIHSGTELQFASNSQLVIPVDQRLKMNRVLLTMQRRLVTAKTDMEDLISRLNQEIAVKDYLDTKVRDLEVQLEATKQRSKENLQQAVMIERDRFTQMQWDMEELRQKSLEMKLKLKSEEDEKSSTVLIKESTIDENFELLDDLNATKEQLEKLSKQYEELEAKSKADIKVLVKEVKSLRRSQTELKQELSQSLKEKSEVEKLLELERQIGEHGKIGRRKLLNECRILCNQLQECSAKLSIEDEDNPITESASLTDALNLLTKSDDQLALLLAEAQQLSVEDGTTTRANVHFGIDDDDSRTIDVELRKMLAEIFTDNARLRKQVNAALRRVLKMDKVCNSNIEAPRISIPSEPVET
ncbi:phox domain-containing family protein [Tripterygium wilfordii]|uniref:Phox domain-containing family protein n=1 Tax=Tripterygium wilfordii TaxID=458696 RepID=A0A7J7DP68_TRIWF|nr:PX domain-containing protein EREL1 isoform X2 [Tripterygium wilfordii]XP_038700728.1 PX domain-containing protein EREL1 isoform X2 [Tripterygium wilfordii]KAF5748170.1 phox domain-containing family protein [Tripterygium wilfordii]